VNTRSGFSLIELIIIITVMGIVMGFATLAFHQWQLKSNVEGQVREMFSDLSEARVRAFHEKKLYRIVYQPSNYVLRSYSSENEPKSAGITVSSRNVNYGLTRKSGTDLTADITDYFVEFDTRGFASNNFTVIINPLMAGTSLDCLVIFDTRVNMGKINGTTCEFK
jgi:prepilin-type N-terminal cleavage/methylation domain-containing protein